MFILQQYDKTELKNSEWTMIFIWYDQAAERGYRICDREHQGNCLQGSVTGLSP